MNENEPEYVDREIIYKDCKRSFVFTADGQKFFAGMNYHDPVRCKMCRLKNRQNIQRQSEVAAQIVE